MTRIHHSLKNCTTQLDKVLKQKRQLEILSFGLGLLVFLILITLYYNGVWREQRLNNGNESAITQPLILPVGWSNTVPIPVTAKATEVVEDFGLAEETVTFTTPMTPEEVIEYYRATLTETGGLVETSLSTDEKKILVVRTPDNKRTIIYAGVVDGVSVVTINVEPSPAKTVDE